MPRYSVYLGRDLQRSFTMAKPRVLIGRAEDADIQLDNPAISRKHAEIRKVGNSYVVADLSGKNGVFVNGRMVNNQILKDKDRIEIFKYTLVFERSEEEAALDDVKAQGGAKAAYAVDADAFLSAAEDGGGPAAPKGPRVSAKVDHRAATMMVAPEQIAKVRETMQTKQGAHLLVATPKGQAVAKLDKERTTLGKDAAADVRIEGNLFMPGVVAEIRRTGKKFEITYLGNFFSTLLGAGAKVNGTPLKPGVPTFLDDGAKIDLGANRIIFHDAV